MSDVVTGSTGVSGIVGARQLDDRAIRIYRRIDRTLVSEDHLVAPWALVRDTSILEGLSEPPVASTRLQGTDPLQWKVTFRRWPLLWEAVQRALAIESERRRQRLLSFLDLDDLVLLPDPIEQWMVSTGSRFFVGLSAHDFVRVQVAIQTAAPAGRSSRADRSPDRIQVISATANDGRKIVFRLRKNDEVSLLSSFLEWIREADPDFIEARDLSTHLLPYLSTRCALLGLSCDLGRDSTQLRSVPQPVGRGLWEVPGRNLLDPSDAMRHAGPIAFALLPPRRTHTTDRATSPAQQSLSQICGDVRERSERFLRLAQPLHAVVPMTPERLSRSGPGHWFESWMLADRLREERSIPSSSRVAPPGETAGPNGMSGLFSPATELVILPLKVNALAAAVAESHHVPEWVRHALTAWPIPEKRETGSVWMRSGAPSTILFPTLLLTGLVDAVRARTSRLSVPVLATILDSRLEERMRAVVSQLSTHNVTVVQRSVDRLYVEIPDNLGKAASDGSFWDRVSEGLPEGSRAVPVRRLDSLISLGPRVLIGMADRSIIYLLRSHPTRATEQYLREYHVRALDCILQKQWNRLQGITIEMLRRVRTRSWHVAEFCRRETLTESLDEYERAIAERKRNPAAAYEALIRAEETFRKERERFRPSTGETTPAEPSRKRPVAGTTVVYYVAGNRRDQNVADMSRLAESWDPSAPDENSDYYVDRLRQAAERYRVLLDESDFRRVFSEESLFPFQDAEIKPVRRGFEASERTRDKIDGTGSGIWLDLERS